MRRSTIIGIVLWLLLAATNPVNADRCFIQWNELMNSSEIIAKGYLEKIEQCSWDDNTVKAINSTARFRISSIYKGEKIQKIDVFEECLVIVEDSAHLTELGEYFLFLPKNKSGMSTGGREKKPDDICPYFSRNPREILITQRGVC